jgi:hypothetical protein
VREAGGARLPWVRPAVRKVLRVKCGAGKTVLTRYRNWLWVDLAEAKSPPDVNVHVNFSFPRRHSRSDSQTTACSRRYVDGLRDGNTVSADGVTHACGSPTARRKEVRDSATDQEATARIVRVKDSHLGAETGLRVVVQRMHQQRGQRDSAECGTANERAVSAVSWVALLVSRNRALSIVASHAPGVDVGIIQELLDLVPGRRSFFQGLCRRFRLEEELRRQEVS